MKTFLNRIPALLLFVSLIVTGCDPSEVPITAASDDSSDISERQAGEVIPGQYIVVLKAETELAGKTARETISSMVAENGVSERHRYGSALSGFAGTFTDEAIERVRNNPLVDYVEQDRVVTLPPFSTLGRCDKNPDKPGCPGAEEEPPVTEDPAEVESTPWGITRVMGGISSDKVACVLDTGVDLDHRDLNIANGFHKSFLSGREADNPDDQNGHGTHVAGTIGAIGNNGVDVIGVAAGATIVSIRVLDRRGSGSYSGVIAGVDYVLELNGVCDVANMSLGGGVSTSLDAAVKAASAKTPFSLAAGNESDDALNHSPARAGLDESNIYTISAMDVNDNWAYFSNYGTAVDFAAPGYSIESLWKNGGTNTISGTSMAAPHVAGIILLGTVRSDGAVNGDPDGNADPIAVH